jgi:transposase InsO family protein
MVVEQFAFDGGEEALGEGVVPALSGAAYRQGDLAVAGEGREGGRGVLPQYTSWAFTDRARASGLLPSMGSIGDCYDNAMIESFWGRVQTELLNRQRWRTRIELANALFEYLEIFHNRRRRHSSLGMLTPIEYELRATRAEPVA